MKTLWLKKGEDRRIRAGHLWIFSNEIDSAKSPLPDFEPGENATLRDARGAVLGSVFVNPHSLICARLYSRKADLPLDAELLRQRNLYHQLNQEAHTAMEACGGTAQGQSAMAKFNTKMGISMKTLTDKSTRNLAEMLTQGSGMGVVDCVKAQKDYPNAAPGTKRLAQRLMEFEEDNRVRLEQFL